MGGHFHFAVSSSSVPNDHGCVKILASPVGLMPGLGTGLPVAWGEGQGCVLAKFLTNGC